MRGRLRKARSLVLDTSPLRESVPYRALWVGQLVSQFGTQMRFVAVAFQVFAISGSTVAVGLVSLVEVLPIMIFSVVGGAMADAFDRKRVMAIAQVALAVSSFALAILTLSGTTNLPLIFGLVALGGALDSIDRPARGATMPSLVTAEQLPGAMALRQVVFFLAAIAGPALGGLLITFFDVGWVYVVDGVTFLAALLALRWVPSVGHHVVDGGDEPNRVTLASIKEGLGFTLRTPLILSIFVTDLVAMIFGMPRAVFPALAEDTFHIGASGLGLLYAAPAVGALLGALGSGWAKRVDRQGVAVLVSVTVWGGAVALAGLSLFSLALTLVFLAIAGAADVISAVFRGTMLCKRRPTICLGGSAL